MRKVIFIFFVLLSFSGHAQELSWDYIKEIKHHNKKVRLVEYSPYKQWIALSLGDQISILDALGNEIVLLDREGTYGSIKFSPDEKYLLIQNWRSYGDVGFLDMSDFLVKDVRHQEGMSGVPEFIHGGQQLLFSDKKEINVFKRDDRNQLVHHQVFHKNGEKDINDFTISSSGEWLVVRETGTIHLSQDYKYSGFDVYLYQWMNDRFEQKTKYSSDESKTFVEFIPETETVVMGISKDYKEEYHSLRMFDCSKGRFDHIFELPTQDNLAYPHFSKDGKWMAIANRGIEFYQIGNKELTPYSEKLLFYYNPHIMEFSPDGRYLLIYQSDKELIQWNMSGVGGDIRSQIYQTIEIDLSPAFKQVISDCSDCFKNLNTDLVGPKGEFETSDQFEERRKKVKASVLSILQKELEDLHRVNYKGKKYLKSGYLIGYNADREVYKANILGEEVAIRVPLKEAREFKKHFTNALVKYSKRDGGDHIIFEDFTLYDPKSGKEYQFYFKYNPFDFHPEKARSGSYGSNLSTEQFKLARPGIQSKNDTGRTVYGLVIATNEYQEFGDLINPIIDGEAVASELKDRYGAQCEIVYNPSLSELIMKLRSYSERSYNKNDELLIFIAGHGHFDPVFVDGYIVASDSKQKDGARLSYLSHSNLKTIVKNIPCEHILLVMDVCFGGTFDQEVAAGHRGASAYDNVDTEYFVNRKLKYKTRQFITSGGNEYVADGIAGQHSPFARNFLEALRSDGGKDGVLTIGEMKLFLDKTSQQPYYGEFSGNEPGSDFLLIKVE